MNKKIRFLESYIVFFKIGLLTIGGGYTMLPLMVKELCTNKGWLKEEEIMDSFSLAQSVPGVIAVNTSVLLGYKLSKLKGALAFCLGVISPSILTILAVARVYEQFVGNKLIENALRGIRIAVLALLVSTVISLIGKSIKDFWGVILAISAFVVISVLKVSPFIVIVAGIVLSIFIYYRRGRDDEHIDSTR